MIKTIVIDDNPNDRFHLMKILQYCGNINVVSSEFSITDAFNAILKLRPSLIFSSFKIGNSNVGELIKRLNEFQMKPAVIISHNSPEFAIEALRLGVYDYYLKPLKMTEVAASIKRFNRTNFLKEEIDPEIISGLSQREHQILDLMVLGKTSKEIANILYISRNTVNTHRSNILRKCEAKNTADLIGMAVIH